jgi:hypothetical protein
MADGQYLDSHEFTVVIGRTPRQISPVVRTDNTPRTQNGHIRNDTRDVSRRIPRAQIDRFPGEIVSRVIARVRA